MKRLFIIACLIMPLTAESSGIPTIDIAGLIQNLKDGLIQVKQFKEQLTEAKNRLNQLKDDAQTYKDMVDGHFDFEAILNDPSLNAALALEDWKDIYDNVGDISDLRDEFKLNSNNPANQGKWDSELKAYRAQTEFYNMSVKRNENLRALLDQFTTATNPAAKADLANSIEFENTQVENDAEMMKSMTALMEQRGIFEREQSALSKKEQMKGVGLPIDYSSAYDNINQ